MQLSKYIIPLLYRYDCVTIPDFGAFIGQRVSAQFNTQNATFYPPKKHIIFNKDIVYNDGILASYIAKTESISFEKAVEFIYKQTSFYCEKLANDETVLFPQLGYLKPTAEGTITFEALANTNFLADAFGLTPVTALSNQTTLKPSVTSLQKETNNSSYLKYAAIAVIALGISGFIINKAYNNSLETKHRIAQEQADKMLESKIDEATFIINKPLPSVLLSVKKQSGNYHVIAGAFRIEENAYKKVEQLKEKGFHARVIGKNKYGLHPVVYESFENRSDALASLNSIRKNYNSEAWLFIKKL